MSKEWPERIPIERQHAQVYMLRLVADKATHEAIMGIEKHGPMMSFHEGFAILKEEVDELWDDVKANLSGDNPEIECIQIAAVAMRMAIAYRRQRLPDEEDPFAE
jgi:hypothetical protein